jgi:hypothetical protein
MNNQNKKKKEEVQYDKTNDGKKNKADQHVPIFERKSGAKFNDFFSNDENFVLPPINSPPQ